MVAFALTVAYNGAPFAGFARQPDQLTVQGELERALSTALRRPVETTCAGRTDAGVHARGQVVSFEASEGEAAELDLRRLARSLNALTHDAISVKDVRRAPDGFSARFDATAREYRYFLAVGDAAPVFMAEFSWHVGPLDVAAMHRASRCLIGEHDFKSFCKAVSAVDKPTRRNVMEVSFSEQDAFGEPLVVVKVVGSSFLHSMVRSIVGTLVQVGHGNRPESWVVEALAARDRTAAGECAPAKGLVFWKVSYGEE